MKSKNDILNRLREKGEHGNKSQPSKWEDRDIFADYPATSDRLVDVFKKQLEKLSGELYITRSTEEVVQILLDLLNTVSPDQSRAHQSPLIDDLKVLNENLRQYLSNNDLGNLTSEEFANLKIGITQADFLIARTGSVFLRTVSAGGRRLSVLPPTHIVLAKEDQIVSSLDDVFIENDVNDESWSYATIITGPSRTSDIEKQLVLGAHGPKRLIVILIKE